MAAETATYKTAEGTQINIQSDDTVASSKITITLAAPASTTARWELIHASGFSDAAGATLTITSNSNVYMTRKPGTADFSIDPIKPLPIGEGGQAVTLELACTTTGKLNVVAEMVPNHTSFDVIS